MQPCDPELTLALLRIVLDCDLQDLDIALVIDLVAQLVCDLHDITEGM